MAEQLLGVAQLILHGLAHGELQREALGRNGRHLGARDDGLNGPRGLGIGDGPAGCGAGVAYLPRGK